MRDKHAVEKYKADIKAQLTRAGLIRGQPRSSMTQSQSSPKIVPSQSFTTSTHAGPGHRSVSTSHLDAPNIDLGYRQVDVSSSQHLQHPISSSPLPSPANPIRRMTSFSEPNLNQPSLHLGLDFNSQSPPFQYSPSSTSPLSTITTPDATQYDPFSFDYDAQGQATALPPQTSQHLSPSASPQAQQHLPLVLPATQNPTHSTFSDQSSVEAQHVLYYFEHVRRMQYIFAGNSITNVTYSLIVQEPQGAVTNAVCALASLHYARMRVAQGLEAPNLEHTTAKYFFGEALFQLTSTQQIRGQYSESDAIAALHLVSFSLFSGGTTDWQGVLDIALEWLAQTGITQDEDPKLALLNMNFAGQCAVKLTLWTDIFASLTLMRAPRYISFYRRLLAGEGGFWHSEGDLRMEALVGIPDEVLLAFAEVSALAHWKAQQQRHASLSVRELIRRGNEIEQQLRQHSADPASFAETDQAPLHPSLPSIGVTQVPMSSLNSGIPSAHGVQSVGPFPDEEMRRVVASIFRETAILYLNTILSDSNPAVAEISTSVEAISQFLNQLPPSEVDRSLVFPICLAGCLTDDHGHREMYKARLQGQDESIGNLLQTRAIMETVWQRRDVQGGLTAVDWRETTRERGMNLLLM